MAGELSDSIVTYLQARHRKEDAVAAWHKVNNALREAEAGFDASVEALNAFTSTACPKRVYALTEGTILIERRAGCKAPIVAHFNAAGEIIA